MRNAFCLLMAGILLFSSCRFVGGKRVNGNGVMRTEQRSVSDFSGVSIVGNIDVVLIPGTNHAVRIEADENLLSYIKTEKKGDVLEIGTRRGYNLRSDDGIKVYVTAPVFNTVDVVGGGNVNSEAKLIANNKLKMEVTGSGDVKLDIDAPEVDAQITGSGNIILAGNTRNFSAEITGSGDLRGFDLLSEKTEVEISGSGNAQVFASKQLGVEINGSGNVDYKGNPPAINQDISGSGSVKKVQ